MPWGDAALAWGGARFKPCARAQLYRVLSCSSSCGQMTYTDAAREPPTIAEAGADRARAMSSFMIVQFDSYGRMG